MTKPSSGKPRKPHNGRSRSQPRRDGGSGGKARSPGKSSRDGQRSGGGKPRREQSSGRHRTQSSQPKRSSERGQRSGGATPGSREKLRTAGSGGGDLPNWIKEEVARVTPKDRRDTVLNLLSDAADAFADGRYGKAHHLLGRAKKETTRVATVRELLGLTAYRMGHWDEALKELRTYRRIDGDTSHMPVEMDCQRALGRGHDVEKTWERYRELGGRAGTDAEMKVVYASFLLDEGRPRDAWRVVNPGRIGKTPKEWDLRQWFVAARTAIELGDMKTARQLIRAIEEHELAFPGLEELHAKLDVDEG